MLEQRKRQIDEASGWSEPEAPKPAPKPKDNEYKDPILE